MQFAETDLAGMAHFSNFFRYMEEAEHALWRSAGLTIDSATSELKWPRVSATFDFKRPLKFEDEFEVLVSIVSVSARTITYGHAVVRGDTTIGTGSVTAACVRRGPDGEMSAVAIPPDILDRLHAAI